MKKSSIPHNTTKGSVSITQRIENLDKSELHAVLSTASRGVPYTSLIAFALNPDTGGILFATPRNTMKYRNILRNKKVSLLIDNRSNTKGDYMKAEAITLVGMAHPVRRSKKWTILAGVLLRKHPDLKSFVHAPSTALVIVEPDRYIHVSRFQTVTEKKQRTS
jgi:hypothetical protein